MLLQVYKRGVPPAVDASLVSFFGEPLAANGSEDRAYVIADAAAHASMADQAGDELVASVEGLYIHASPIVTGPPAEPKQP